MVWRFVLPFWVSHVTLWFFVGFRVFEKIATSPSLYELALGRGKPLLISLTQRIWMLSNLLRECVLCRWFIPVPSNYDCFKFLTWVLPLLLLRSLEFLLYTFAHSLLLSGGRLLATLRAIVTVTAFQSGIQTIPPFLSVLQVKWDRHESLG